MTEKTLEDENEINSKEIEIAKTIYSLTEKPQNHPILFNQGIVEHCLNIISSVETEDALILLSTCIYLFLTQGTCFIVEKKKKKTNTNWLLF